MSDLDPQLISILVYREHQRIVTDIDSMEWVLDHVGEKYDRKESNRQAQIHHQWVDYLCPHCFDPQIFELLDALTAFTGSYMEGSRNLPKRFEELKDAAVKYQWKQIEFIKELGCDYRKNLDDDGKIHDDVLDEYQKRYESEGPLSDEEAANLLREQYEIATALFDDSEDESDEHDEDEDFEKLQVINDTKRANNRLKPVGDTCYAIAHGRNSRPVSKERTLLAARLDRELAPEDEHGPELRSALTAFWKAHRKGVESSILEELAGHVYAATRQVQKDRWRRLKTKYGDIHHYFTPFGQIKSEYKIPATPKHKKGDEEPGCMGCLVLLILVAAVAAWWWFW